MNKEIKDTWVGKISIWVVCYPHIIAAIYGTSVILNYFVLGWYGLYIAAASTLLGLVVGGLIFLYTIYTLQSAQANSQA